MALQPPRSSEEQEPKVLRHPLTQKVSQHRSWHRREMRRVGRPESCESVNTYKNESGLGDALTSLCTLEKLESRAT